MVGVKACRYFGSQGATILQYSLQSLYFAAKRKGETIRVALLKVN